jgi:hypothetical protein
MKFGDIREFDAVGRNDLAAKDEVEQLLRFAFRHRRSLR